MSLPLRINQFVGCCLAQVIWLDEMAYDYGAYGRSSSSPTDDELDYHYGLSLEEWARDKPLSILQLDPADRAVLRIAGITNIGNYLRACAR